MATNRLHPSSLLSIAALMLGSVTEAGPIAQIYTLCDATRANRVTLTPTSVPIVIHSPNYEHGVYPNHLNCSFILEAGDEAVVLIFEFNIFVLEYNSICEHDFLCVHGVKFCGAWAKGQVFRQVLPAYDKSTMSFVTDKSRGFAGFEITVSARHVANNEAVLEPTGMGSILHTLTFVNVIYDPEMSYVDKCPILDEFSTTTKRPTTTTEQPTTIALQLSSATDDIYTMKCECQCPLPDNYYAKPDVD